MKKMRKRGKRRNKLETQMSTLVEKNIALQMSLTPADKHTA